MTRSSQPEDFAEALGSLPSLSALAKDLGLPDETVYSWRRRNSIPSAYWPRVEQHARDVGIKGLTYAIFRRFDEDRWHARHIAKRAVLQGRQVSSPSKVAAKP